MEIHSEFPPGNILVYSHKLQTVKQHFQRPLCAAFSYLADDSAWQSYCALVTNGDWSHVGTCFSLLLHIALILRSELCFHLQHRPHLIYTI